MTSIKYQSPRIISSEWGKLEVESLGQGKDFKLWPGGGDAWDWRETGTSHSAGIQIGDVAELVEKGCEVVILTKGKFSRLRVPKETLQYLEERNIETFVANTTRGIKRYNELTSQNMRVGGLFHSTC